MSAMVILPQVAAFEVVLSKNAVAIAPNTLVVNLIFIYSSPFAKSFSFIKIIKKRNFLMDSEKKINLNFDYITK
jgi:hypothetical protein